MNPGPDASTRRSWGLLAAELALLALLLLFAPCADAFVYWTSDDIGRANNNGTGVDKKFIDLVPNQFALDVAVSPADLYWLNVFNDHASIARATLNGTGVIPGLVDSSAMLTAPVNIDVADTHVYWAAPPSGVRGWIGRANLDGTQVRHDLVTAEGEVADVAVSESHVYWVSFFKGPPQSASIGRASLDGTGVDQDFIPNMLGTWGTTVDDSHIYWIKWTTGTIGRANLDGGGVQPNFITGVNGAERGIAVDGSHIYWTNPITDSIGRANLDGSGVKEDFITGIDSPTGVAVDGLPLAAGKVKANPNQVVKAVLVKLKVAATEQLTARANGVIKFNPTYKLKPRTVEVAAGESKVLKLKPKRKSQSKKIAEALDQGRKVTAKLKVRLTGKSGNSTTEKLSVRLKRAG